MFCNICFLLFIIFSNFSERNILGGDNNSFQIGILRIFGIVVAYDSSDAIIYIHINA